MQSCVHTDQCVSVVRAVEVPVFISFCSSYNHVTEVRELLGVTLVLKFVMQNDGDFVDVIVLYIAINHSVMLAIKLIGFQMVLTMARAITFRMTRFMDCPHLSLNKSNVTVTTSVSLRCKSEEALALSLDTLYQLTTSIYMHLMSDVQ